MRRRSACGLFALTRMRSERRLQGSAAKREGSSRSGAVQGSSRTSGGSLWNATPARVCERLVVPGDVKVLGIDDETAEPLRVHIRRLVPRLGCEGCGGPLRSDGEREVELVDLPAFARPARVVCGTSTGSAARIRGARRAPSPNRIPRSRRRARS